MSGVGMPPPPEFSRRLVVDTLGVDGGEREIEANPAECRALAKRFRLEAVASLTATLRLIRLRGGQAGMVRVRGRLVAEVVQNCVVTLEPVPARVEESFNALFAPEAEVGDDEALFDPFAEEETVPEAMANGVIDLGELTAQHLSLALDPYPRAPGVEFTGFDDDAPDEEVSPRNPFGALAALRRGH